MTESDLAITGALQHITGCWENDRTKDAWVFKPLKGKGYAAMEIIQADSGMRVTYAYKTLLENKILYLEIDNTYFQVIEINIADSIVMQLKKQDGNIITLHKKL